MGEKTKLTDITVVVDASGSMEPLTKDTIGGFNQFVKGQQEVANAGKAVVSLVTFNTEMQPVFVGKDVNEVEPLTNGSYRPAGGTALLDTLARAIDSAAERVKQNGADKTIFVIITDGEENSSRQFTRKQVFDRITDKRLSGWEFMFLGANQDAITEAAKIGIDYKWAANFTGDKYGATYTLASTNVARSRTTADADVTFDSAQRQELVGN